MSQENINFCRSWLKLARPNEAKEYTIIIYNKAPEPNTAHKRQHRWTPDSNQQGLSSSHRIGMIGSWEDPTDGV